eukprot:GHVN01057522.1.p2 GENE.GHVN01057522.1~~GHVN01057522.1.p2  ORF type:complete len:169 (+),score=33.91 GHVN01057522.1:2364-2870(+)
MEIHDDAWSEWDPKRDAAKEETFEGSTTTATRASSAGAASGGGEFPKQMKSEPSSPHHFAKEQKNNHSQRAEAHNEERRAGNETTASPSTRRHTIGEDRWRGAEAPTGSTSHPFEMLSDTSARHQQRPSTTRWSTSRHLRSFRDIISAPFTSGRLKRFVTRSRSASQE